MNNTTNTHGGKRTGVGRPPVDNLRRIRTIKATDEEWESIRKNAEKEGLSISEYIRKKSLE